MRGAAAIVGRATGTREMLPLTTHHLADRVDAVLLTGGSAYGLDAAAGVMRWMEERGRGFAVGPGVVPIVPAAVVFDLAPLGRFDARPTPAMAYDACERASSHDVAEGSVGAGTGTTVGKGAGVERAMKGGVGCAVASSGESNVVVAGALHVGALAVVNALGDVRDDRGAILAGARDGSGGFVDVARFLARGGGDGEVAAAAMRNTTLAVVMASVPLSRAELQQVAQAATAAFHRRITPAGTSFDGDVVFALAPLDTEEETDEARDAARGAARDAVSTAVSEAASGAGGPPRRDVASSPSLGHHPSIARRADFSPAALLQVEALAVAALELAIERAVRLARGRDGIPGLGDDGEPGDDREAGSGEVGGGTHHGQRDSGP
jgi:L-aminopeptidase/D-esterase-like protein